MPLTLRCWHLPALGAIALGASWLFPLAGAGRPTDQEIALRLAASVGDDSRTWLVNHYDPDSLSDLQLVRQDSPDRLIVRASYTFNGGQRGWVMARVIGGQIQCLQYWDKDSCKAVGAFAEQGALPPLTNVPNRPVGGPMGCIPGQSCMGAGLNFDPPEGDDAEEPSDDEQETEQAPPPRNDQEDEGRDTTHNEGGGNDGGGNEGE